MMKKKKKKKKKSVYLKKYKNSSTSMETKHNQLMCLCYWNFSTENKKGFISLEKLV